MAGLDEMLSMLEPEPEADPEGDANGDTNDDPNDDPGDLDGLDDDSNDDPDNPDDPDDPDDPEGQKQEQNALPENFNLDEAQVQLRDGSEVSFKELEDSYIENQTPVEETAIYQDYVTAQRELQESNKKVGTALNAVVSLEEPTLRLLVSLIPPEPSRSLKEDDPDAYYAQKDQREKIKGYISDQWGKLTAEKDRIIGEVLDEKELEKHANQEKQLLQRSFPALRNEKFSTEFFKITTETGKFLGFGEDEMKSVKDHRMLKMLYLAGLGREVVKNKTKLLRDGNLSDNKGGKKNQRQQKTKGSKPAKTIRQLVNNKKGSGRTVGQQTRKNLNGAASKAGEPLSWQDAMKTNWMNLD